MFRLDPFSALCGFLSTIVVPVVAMALGYVDVAFAIPYLKMFPLVVGVNMGVMYWMGPAPAVLAAGLLQPLVRLLPVLEDVQLLIIYGGVPVIAVGLTLQLMRFVHFLAQLGVLGAYR